MMRTTHIFLAVAVFSSMVFANAEDVQDYSEYYKNYYETHSAQERQPAFPRQDLFTALATPETNLVIGGFGLLFGVVGLAAYINQLDDSQSMCKTAKELGDTKLTVTSTTEIADFALANDAGTHADNTALLKTFATSIRAQFNALENKINGYSTPDCSS